jgi:DNA invertase Pin-like site-specific DNA recombinase
VVYVRQASWDDAGGKSAEHQLKAVLRWCEENHVPVVGTVMDDRASASRFTRVEWPGLTIALDMVTALRATMLCTPHVSEITRSVAEVGRVLRVLANAGANWVGVDSMRNSVAEFDPVAVRRRGRRGMGA